MCLDEQAFNEHIICTYWCNKVLHSQEIPQFIKTKPKAALPKPFTFQLWQQRHGTVVFIIIIMLTISIALMRGHDPKRKQSHQIIFWSTEKIAL